MGIKVPYNNEYCRGDHSLQHAIQTLIRPSPENLAWHRERSLHRLVTRVADKELSRQCTIHDDGNWSHMGLDHLGDDKGRSHTYLAGRPCRREQCQYPVMTPWRSSLSIGEFVGIAVQHVRKQFLVLSLRSLQYYRPFLGREWQ